MYKLCVTEKSAAQHQKFEQAFLELLLEVSYDNIRISEVCRRAGYSRKVFYRLFDQKSDVLQALIDHTLLDFENYAPDPAEVGEGNLHRFFGYWKEQHLLLTALGANHGTGLLTERAIRHVLSEDSLVLKTFGADDSGFGRETVVFFISGVFSLVQDWHESGYLRSIDEMSGLLMQLLSTTPIKCRMPDVWNHRPI